MVQLCHTRALARYKTPYRLRQGVAISRLARGSPEVQLLKPCSLRVASVGRVGQEIYGDHMTFTSGFKIAVSCLALSTLVACGQKAADGSTAATATKAEQERSTIWDIFKDQNSDVKVSVNRFIWNAALEVLNFMPVESVDPFTGVIVMGYGTPPGGGSAYRATVYVKDPALEARSLVVALQGRNGRPVSASTQRAVEDAILSRARQLRIKDSKY